MASESARARAFEAFYERIGRKRYGPEFIESIVQTMRIPDGLVCRDEQTSAWTRWRTWGNSSETARSSWHSSGWDLDQIDCAVDLHWFQTSQIEDNLQLLEWVESRTPEERKAARNLPEVRRRKASISRSFVKAEARGQVDLSRGKIHNLTSPTFGPQVVEKLVLVSDTRDYLPKNPAFVEFLTESGSLQLLEEMERARDAYFASRKVLRVWEKRFLVSGTTKGPILITEKEYKDKGSSSSEEHVLLGTGTGQTTTDSVTISGSGPDESVRTGVAGNGPLTASDLQTTGRGGLPAGVKQSPAMPSPKPAFTPPVEHPPPEDVKPVIDAVLQRHQFQLHVNDAIEILQFCREKHNDPSITPQEVARFVWSVDPIRDGGGIRSPRRFLRTAVANEITPEELQCLRGSLARTVAPSTDYTDIGDDPEISSEFCLKCGGQNIRYASGASSQCRCRAKIPMPA